jgi:hypothetical protein
MGEGRLVSIIYINPYRFATVGVTYDVDAQAYITAVDAADGQALETGVRDAINAFVVGCKADGIWAAIKASCILAGARTLAGALVPLVGAAPTNVSNLFVAGDYNRKTGLIGNGTTKHLNSNRNNNADPQNSKHISAFITATAGTGSAPIMGTNTVASGGSWISRNSDNTTSSQRANSAASYSYLNALPISSKLIGVSRSASAVQSHIAAAGVQSSTLASASPINENILVFRAQGAFCPFRLAFYSIGESLDLGLLDTRVATLISTFAAVIP